MQRIEPKDFDTIPWKNGGGITSQIAVSPPGANFNDFLCRVSMAKVEKSGDFSSFPGIDRSLVLLTGNGMILTAGGIDHMLRTGDDPFVFDGGADAYARLVDGPVTDFNVMTRRETHTHEVRSLRTGSTHWTDKRLHAFCVRPATLELDGKQFSLGRWDALVDICASRIDVIAGKVLTISIRSNP